MTTLVMWNIQNFTKDKLDAKNSPQQLKYIITTVGRADIAVIIEVMSGKGELGTLATGNGPLGVLEMLQWLRNFDKNWCAVPPPKLVGLTETGEATNYTETIAVLYRSDKLSFVGPYIWPEADRSQGAKRAVPNNGTKPGPYPDEWSKALPDGNCYAAQFQYFNEQGDEVLFLDGNRRRPLLTHFQELTGAKRLVKVLAVHPSPNADVKSAMSRMTGLAEVAKTDTSSVVIVGGDINIDVFSAVSADQHALDVPALFDGFERWLTVNHGGTMFHPAQYGQEPYGTPTAYLRKLGLDNIYVRYDGGAKPDTGAAWVVDRIGVNIPTAFPGSMAQSLDDIKKITPTDNQLEVFRSAGNFGCAAHHPGASDHLPVVAQF